MTAPLEIRMLPIAELIPAPYNPRLKLKIHEPARRKLAASLREFGLVEPLVWNERTGHVVGGHARLELLREQGATEAPVSVVRLDPAREKALNVVLNNREAQGRFDVARLGELLAEMQELPEFELTGFDAGTLRQLRLEPDCTARAMAAADGEVVLSLEMKEETLGEIQETVDGWIQTLGIRTHLRRR